MFTSNSIEKRRRNTTLTHSRSGCKRWMKKRRGKERRKRGLERHRS